MNRTIDECVYQINTFSMFDEFVQSSTHPNIRKILPYFFLPVIFSLSWFEFLYMNIPNCLLNKRKKQIKLRTFLQFLTMPRHQSKCEVELIFLLQTILSICSNWYCTIWALHHKTNDFEFNLYYSTYFCSKRRIKLNKCSNCN